MNKPKNPWVAGLLNIVIPGLGFIYLAPAFKGLKIKGSRHDFAFLLQFSGILLLFFMVGLFFVNRYADSILEGYQGILISDADIAVEFNPPLAESLKGTSAGLADYLSSSSINLMLSFLLTLPYFF